MGEPNLASVLKRDLEALARVEQAVDGVRVTTHCMYPSNGLVAVTVRGGVRTVVVSDEGGALGEATSAGIPIRDYNGVLAHMVKNQGLSIRNGTIFTFPIPLDAAPAAILHVANASQEVARWLYDHARIKRSRDFRITLADYLKRTFDDRLFHNEIIVGHSNKPHKFANVIKLPQGQRLIIDPVALDASSINARVVANLDIKANNDPHLEQQIVYDDHEDWGPADLNLLQVGADVIPFSRSEEVIGRIAREHRVVTIGVC